MKDVAAARGALVAGLVGMAGCSPSGGGAASTDGGPQDGGLSRAALLQPQVCSSCHAQHYQDWAASMHAYASDDPVFQAMNARGQRETDGGLGAFCVNCHAPMALREGLTTDGLNLASLPAEYHGVTCFFCHAISSVDGTHNAAVVLAGDLVMRGEISDPAANTAHRSTYSPLHDDGALDPSASMCGACHDIVLPPPFAPDGGVALERTFAEWQASAFSGQGGESCTASSCHMVRSSATQAVAQMTGFPASPPPTGRYYHGHDFPAVDVRLTPGPDAGAEAGVTEPPDVALLLSDAIVGDLCVTQRGALRVILDIPNLGHQFPSGAAQDRRLWAQVVAYQGSTVVYESGAVPFGSPAFDAGADPDLWLLRDCLFGPDGDEVHMFWQAASYEGNELPPQNTFDITSPSFRVAQRVQYFPRSGEPGPAFDRATLNLWVQPVGLDVLADLVASGDLDAGVAAAVPILPVPLGVQLPGSNAPVQLEWTAGAAADAGVIPYTDGYDGTVVSCVGTLPTPGPLVATNHKRCSP